MTICAAAWPANRGQSWSRWPTGVAPTTPTRAGGEAPAAATAGAGGPGRERGGDRPGRAVAGDSGGGTRAAVVPLLCRARRGPALRFQALASPVTAPWQAGQASYRQ